MIEIIFVAYCILLVVRCAVTYKITLTLLNSSREVVDARWFRSWISVEWIWNPLKYRFWTAKATQRYLMRRNQWKK